MCIKLILQYILKFLFLYLAAITSTPTVIEVTTTSVILEFRAANYEVDYYRVEYGQGIGSSVDFSSSGTVYHTRGQTTYRFSRTSFRTGVNYYFRVVPYISYPSYRGTPSPTRKVWIPKPGEYSLYNMFF